MRISYKLRAIIGAAALSIGAIAGPAVAGTLTLQTSFDLVTRGNGPDTPGLDGASVLVTSTFDDGTTFEQGFYSALRAVATSTTFEITGASVAETNGTYMPTTGLGLFAANGSSDGYLTNGTTSPFGSNPDGSFFGLENGNGVLVNQVRLDAGGTVGARLEGDALTFDILNDVEIGSGGVLLFSKSGSGGTGYDMLNFANQAFEDTPAVPLPAGFPMLAGGLLVFGAMRRKAKQTA